MSQCEEPKKQNVASVKFGKFAKRGDKVAIIGTVKEITSQYGSTSLYLTVEDGGEVPIIIAPHLVELVNSVRP